MHIHVNWTTLRICFHGLNGSITEWKPMGPENDHCPAHVTGHIAVRMLSTHGNSQNPSLAVGVETITIRSTFQNITRHYNINKFPLHIYVPYLFIFWQNDTASHYYVCFDCDAKMATDVTLLCVRAEMPLIDRSELWIVLYSIKHKGPRENKSLIWFVTDCPQVYIRLINFIDGSARPCRSWDWSIRHIHVESHLQT
jgi:hypothetical protein